MSVPTVKMAFKMLLKNWYVLGTLKLKALKTKSLFLSSPSALTSSFVESSPKIYS